MVFSQFHLIIVFMTYFIFVNGNGSGPASFDCPMRSFALQFSQHIQPWLSTDKLLEIADALNGDPIKQPKNCTVSPNNLPIKPLNKHSKPPKFNHNIHIDTVFIDPMHGSNINNGNINSPFKTIRFGIKYFRNKYKQNNKYQSKQILLRKGVYYLQNTLYFDENDSNLIISNYNGEESIISGAIPLNNLNWKLYKNESNGKNIYSTAISSVVYVNITQIHGLRVNSSRAIRCRFPNANSEVFPPGFGSNINAVHWYGSISNAKPDKIIHPTIPNRKDNPEHDFEYYDLGIGGTACYNFEPKAGFFCSNLTTKGVYKIPKGMIYNKDDLKNAPYWNPEGGIVQAWRSAHWASWMFQIDANKYDANKQNISFLKGGFQDGRGASSGESYYIENVFEELDYETEWFFNETQRILYYKNNFTNQSPNDNNLLFEATKLKVLMNFTGNMTNPIKNIELKGMIFKDTAYTYLDAHGMPSGGDWAMQRTGSIYIEGSEYFKIHDNTFTRLDNIAISINRYNRYHNIYKNEFVWLGSTCITLWGDTVGITFNDSKTSMGYDGTTGIQPRNINISFNLAHEYGIWEKQSAFYWSAKSCENIVFGNIIFNSPRSGLDLNDGFGGGSVYENNIIFNVCRESGSHGPINNWDRQPFLTTVRNGTASMEKAIDYVKRNLLIANYECNFILDTDDGANTFHAWSNVFIYGGSGTKSTYGGHSIRHFNNMYGYVESNCFLANYAGNSDGQYSDYRHWYFNNTCILSTKESSSVLNYGSFACSTNQSQWPVLGNNTIYTVNKNTQNIGLCGHSESYFQSHYNTDLKTQIFQVNDSVHHQFFIQAKQLLFL